MLIILLLTVLIEGLFGKEVNDSSMVSRAAKTFKDLDR